MKLSHALNTSLHPFRYHESLVLSTLAGVQDVERECGAACASLAMPMPLNVSLRAEDLLQLQRHLLQLLEQLESPVPFTPSLKVSQPFLDPRTAILWLSFTDVQSCRSVKYTMSSLHGCTLSC